MRTTPRNTTFWVCGLGLALGLGCSALSPNDLGNKQEPKQQLVALTPDGMTIDVGDSLQMKAALPGSSPTWYWGVSNPAAASIDGQGLVRAIGPGEVTIRACADELGRTCGFAPLTVR